MSRMTTVTSWFEQLWQALFPSYCALCGQYGARMLCAQCAARCPSAGTHCRTCAQEMARGDQQCGRCLRRPPAIDGFFARWRYRDTVRHLVLGGKYRAKKEFLLALAEGMCERLDGIPPVDAVIPMAISRRRLWQRGFNQTHILAAAVAKRLGVKMDKTLLVKTHRPPQSRLHTHGARRRNIRNAFACSAEAPARVLLVDDVATSGATLNEAARILKQHGSTRVYALVAATL